MKSQPPLLYVFIAEEHVHILWKCAYPHTSWYNDSAGTDNISTTPMVDDAAVDSEDSEICKKIVGEPND